MLLILPHLEVLRLVVHWFALMAHKNVLTAVSCLRIVLLVCMSLYAVISTKLPQNSKTSKQSDWELLNNFSVKVAINSP